MNPYYRTPVPENGAAYLKFSLGFKIFGELNRLLDHHFWLSLLVWNVFWWTLLALVAFLVFRTFLPISSQAIVIPGVALVMLFNFGVLKTLVLAWIHLPSLAAFDAIGLPFMRAFLPVIPSTLVLAYVGLQIDTLRRNRALNWFAMAGLQLLALPIFPYATLMMAGLTAFSVTSQLARKPQMWRAAIGYGIVCAVLDFAFLRHGSLAVYEGRSSQFTSSRSCCLT